MCKPSEKRAWPAKQNTLIALMATGDCMMYVYGIYMVYLYGIDVYIYNIW